MADLSLSGYFGFRLLALDALRRLDHQEVADLQTIRQYETEVSAFLNPTSEPSPESTP